MLLNDTIFYKIFPEPLTLQRVTKRKWMRKDFWEEVLPEPSIKGCERFIQVDMEKIKEGGHDFWGLHVYK